jgi:hypothetical protein
MIQLKDLDLEMTEVLDGELGSIVGGGFGFTESGWGFDSSSLGSGLSYSSPVSSTSYYNNLPSVVMVNNPTSTPANTSTWTLTDGVSHNGQTNVDTLNLGVSTRSGSGISGTYSTNGSWSAQGSLGL